ncbi:MAG: TetR/AcrR family transcriptional regulator [Halocynthiibacter sp.]
MARGIAKDHEKKRAAIRRGAAGYFATHGYDRASMTGAARCCGVSKALIYHYYASKEDLLFDIVNTHLSDVAERAEAVSGEKDRLRRVIHAVLLAYRDADAEHKLQGDAIGALPSQKRAPLIALQRRLVDTMGMALAASNPGKLLDKDAAYQATMAVFGMLNWFYMWHRPGRGIDREAYADLVTDMVLGGIGAITTSPT